MKEIWDFFFQIFFSSKEGIVCSSRPSSPRGVRKIIMKEIWEVFFQKIFFFSKERIVCPNRPSSPREGWEVIMKEMWDFFSDFFFPFVTYNRQPGRTCPVEGCTAEIIEWKRIDNVDKSGEMTKISKERRNQQGQNKASGVWGLFNR